MLTKIWRKSKSNLSFSYENTVTKGTNLRPIKAMRCDERFLSLALELILPEKHAHHAFNWPKYACINFSDVWTSGAWHILGLITFCISNRL